MIDRERAEMGARLVEDARKSNREREAAENRRTFADWYADDCARRNREREVAETRALFAAARGVEGNLH